MTEAQSDSFPVDLDKRLHDALGHEVMEADEARELTERIRDGLEEIGPLLLRAEEGRAYLALGYESWRAYAMAEFSVSQSRAYQLLDHAKAKRELEEAVSTDVEISEAAVRDIKGDLSEVVAEVTAAVENGADPQEAVDKAVAEKRSKPLVTSGPVYVKKLETIRSSVFNKFPPSDFVPELSPDERAKTLVFVREAKAYVQTLERWLKA